MLIVMSRKAEPEDFDRVVETIKNLGLNAEITDGENQTTIGIIGNSDLLDASTFENLPAVARIIRLNKPYKLASLDFRLVKTVVKIRNAAVGGDELTMIAGVCSVENREQLYTVARAVSRSGAHLFRGGAFKPRTNPYAFQGLGEKGLQMLAEVREEFGLAIVTEAMDERGIDLVEKYADCIQIGARNMQNYSLLKRAGQSDLPVLLKRGMSATLDDLLCSAEYILAEGNRNVILAERGIRTFSNHARNTLDLSIIPAIRRVSHLPIIVDPSHGTGENFMVAPLARAGIAVGADGIMVEIHPEPAKALSDGSQALTPEQYLEMIEHLRMIYRLISQKEFAFKTA